MKSVFQNFILFSVFLLIFVEPVFAQTGGEIFKDAACGLLGKVLTKDYGGLLTMIAGSLAILASVTGSFKGAWALVFVSVGSFVFPHTVDLLFPGMCPAQ